MMLSGSVELGDLSKSDCFNSPLNIDGHDREFLQRLLESMLNIRFAEKKIAEERRGGAIGGPVHLAIGQEAIPAGVSAHLQKTDCVFGAHRSHSHLLALGSDVKKLFAELLGKKTGHSKGMGGSMHLIDKSIGFYGSTPIVAGTVSLAVGTAMASKFKKNSCVSVVYLGDGACEEGIVHEALNLASILKSPVLFVVENNLFASHMHIAERQPKESCARFAAANDIAYRVVDGNDVLSVSNVSSALISEIRGGAGPGFIEAVTYRWLGHVDWREDVDVGVNRSQCDLARWKKRDPIERLFESMAIHGLLSHSQFHVLKAAISDRMNVLWNEALMEPDLDHGDLLSWVYSK